MVLSTLPGYMGQGKDSPPRSLGLYLRFSNINSRGQKQTFLELDLCWAFHGIFLVFLNPGCILKSSEYFEKLLSWFASWSVKLNLWYGPGHIFFFVIALIIDYLQDNEKHLPWSQWSASSACIYKSHSFMESLFPIQASLFAIFLKQCLSLGILFSRPKQLPA